MKKVNRGEELDLAKILESESLTTRVEQKSEQGEPLITVPSDGNLSTRIIDGILQSPEGVLLVSGSIATSIVVISIAKGAAEIITAWRKR